MVTLAGTQNFSEFELHARAVLGLPIPEITLERVGASAVILADKEGKNPTFSGLKKAMNHTQSDIRIFGKPITRPYRRMAVALTYDKVGSNVDSVKQRAIEIAGMVKVQSN
jgi:phosphoribosylglycinamide formyltransferase 2